MQDQSLSCFEAEVVAVDGMRVILDIEAKSLEKLVSNYESPKHPERFNSGETIDLRSRLKRLEALDRFVACAEDVNRVIEDTLEE